MTDEQSHDWCVAWIHHEKRCAIGRLGDLLNINAAALMDNRPGVAIVRMNLTQWQAKTYCSAVCDMVAARTHQEVPA